MTKKTTAFDVFAECVQAVQAGELIESVSAKDKGFHFQRESQREVLIALSCRSCCVGVEKTKEKLSSNH